MSEREGYPPGVPCWVDTAQPDPNAAIVFYGPLLGWEFAGPGPMPAGIAGQYFVAQINGHDVAGIASLPNLGTPSIASWNTYVRVDDVEQAAERAHQAGGTVLAGPLDALPAGRLAVLIDPAGAAICLWETRAREGAQLVNEAGAWAMSSLHVTDTDAAATFYESLFGWRAELAGSDEAPLTLFHLPGYVGGEPTGPVPRDVVAVMSATPPAAAAQIPPHWNVNFQVEDVDAVVRQAAELGGRVIIPPVDTPGFRNAAVADPWGAALSLSEPTVGR